MNGHPARDSATPEEVKAMRDLPQAPHGAVDQAPGRLPSVRDGVAGMRGGAGKRHQTVLLAGNRLHLSEGPIDLILWADGEHGAVQAAYRAAERRFEGLLAELCAELPLLRMPLGSPSPHATLTAPPIPPALGEGRSLGPPQLPTVPSPQRGGWREAPGGGSNATISSEPPTPNPSPQGGGESVASGERGFKGPIARRMAEACWPHRAVFVTPMAAVAGAVAEAVLGAMTSAAPLTRAYVNDGGDIALHLAPGTSLAVGVVRSLERAVPEGQVIITEDMPVRGIATSGRHGRSFSLGIADAVTVLARDAPSADVAATLIANAVDVDDPAIVRRSARDLDPDSDLTDFPVVTHVGPLAPEQVTAALEAGVACAEAMRRAGLIEGALLTLAGEWRSVGAPLSSRALCPGSISPREPRKPDAGSWRQAPG